MCNGGWQRLEFACQRCSSAHVRGAAVMAQRSEEHEDGRTPGYELVRARCAMRSLPTKQLVICMVLAEEYAR